MYVHVQYRCIRLYAGQKYMYMYMCMYMYSAENVHVHVHNVKRFTKEHKHTYTSKLKLPSLGKGGNERSSDRYFRKGSSYP